MNKKVLLGCGCGLAVLLVLTALGSVLFMSGSNIVTFTKALIEEGQERAAWVAPADGTTGEALFPASVGTVRRQSIDRVSGLSLLNIQREGEHGSYRLPNGSAVEIYVWRVAEGEVSGIIDDIGRAIDDGPYSTRMQFNFNQNAMRFSFSPPTTSGRIWFNKGWMFLFITGDAVELEPIETNYVDAIESVGNSYDELPLLPEAETNASAAQ